VAPDGRCVRSHVSREMRGALDRKPGVVLAHTRTALIDDKGAVIGTLIASTARCRPSVRFAAYVSQRKCFEIFGVFRRDVLARTSSHRRASGIPTCVGGPPPLMGKIHEVPEYLYFNRTTRRNVAPVPNVPPSHRLARPETKGKILSAGGAWDTNTPRPRWKSPAADERRRALMQLLPWAGGCGRARVEPRYGWLPGCHAAVQGSTGRSPQGRQRMRSEAVLLNRAAWKSRRVFVTGHTGFKAPGSPSGSRRGRPRDRYALEPPTTPSLFDLAGRRSRHDVDPRDVRDLARLQNAIV